MKKLFLYILSVFIIMVVLTLIIFDNDNTDNKKNPLNIKLDVLNNIDKKIDFFKYKYIDRYISFKESNPNLEDIDIVTRVNLNLDKPYYSNVKASDYLNKTTILVNKYIYLPQNYVPNNLVEINSKYSNSNKMLVNEAKEKFEDMASNAFKEGYIIRAISAYRSYDYQKTLYDNYVAKDGKINADTYSARPGFSEHQTGLVVDIDNGIVDYNNFENTEEFKWMQENSYKYGFILRYPKGKEDITGYQYESWHYRYVGIDIATYIQKNNLTFDEYYARFIEK